PHPVLRILALIAGLACLVLGVVGWLVPVVTGIPFYILGFALLGYSSRRLRCWLRRAERRLPLRARVALRRMHAWRRAKQRAKRFAKERRAAL
ncbi:MAG TPA: hypothetical protein VGC54_15115, partial [Planctomycetota bacterium]